MRRWLVLVQVCTPAVVGGGQQGLTDHVQAEQQPDCLDRDKRCQHRLLQLVHRLFQCGYRGGVLHADRADFDHQILGGQQHRAKVAFAALAQLHEADRHAEETGDAKGVVVAHRFEMATDAFRACVDAEQRLGERTLCARWRRKETQAGA